MLGRCGTAADVDGCLCEVGYCCCCCPAACNERYEEVLETFGLNLLKTPPSFELDFVASSPAMNLFKLLSKVPQTLSNLGLPNQLPSDTPAPDNLSLNNLAEYISFGLTGTPFEALNEAVAVSKYLWASVNKL